tara:strand:- start:1941 stop:3194 length:1254 start_codon:yes stop_codon:yes gene_type:complete
MTNQKILEITDLNGYARGVSKSEEGKIVFVDNTLPGDLVEVDYTQHNKRFSLAKIKTITEPSPWRTEAFCRHFNQCNGCQLQYTKLNHYLEAKQRVLRSKLRGPLKPFAHNKIIPSPLTHYRNKATFQWNPQSKSLSYLNENNEEIPINECKILDTEISNWLSNLKNLKRSINFPTRLVIKHLPQQGLVLGIHSPHRPVAIEDIQPFMAIYWLEYEKVEAFGKLKWIKPPKQSLTEKLGNIAIGWHPQGFFQTNRWVANQMFSKIKHWIINNKIKIVWDFYCGSGWILQFIKQHIQLGYGFEISQNAINIAKQVPNAQNLHFIQANLPYIPKNKYPIADCWIFNPPRKGIGKKTLEALFNQSYSPTTVIYMSCNPDSLSADLKMLTKFGYQAEMCKFYDMFPWTSHFEALCLLKKSV